MKKYWKWAKADYQAGGLRRVVIVGLAINLVSLAVVGIWLAVR